MMTSLNFAFLLTSPKHAYRYQPATTLVLLTTILLLWPTTTTVRAQNMAPTIRLSLSLNNGTTVHVSENTPVNSLIGVVEVQDDDPGAAGQVTCVTEDTYVGLVPMSINQNMYKVVLNLALDREVQETFDVAIVCSDAGQPPKASTAEFSIVVKDVNDNAPEFTSEVYMGQIMENEHDSKKLNIQVRAHDPDHGRNGDIEYSIEDENGGTTDLFEIDPELGDIYSLSSFDREETREITLVVKATDYGIPPQSSLAIVKIEVLDQNDVYPTIQTSVMEVREGLKPMSKVGQIIATDGDLDKAGTVVFSMMDSPQPIPPFIVQQDGTVLAAVPLDRELRDAYTIHVKATDQGTPPLSSQHAIDIRVTDINDNPPIIMRPRPDGHGGVDYGYGIGIDTSANGDQKTNGSDVLAIDWYCPPGSPSGDRVVYQAQARDNDEGENGRVTYAIPFVNDAPSGGDSLFKIDPNSGKISLQRCVRKSDTPTQTLTLSFRDNGDPDSLEVMIKFNVTLDIDFNALTTPIPSTSRVATSANSPSSAHAPTRLVDSLLLAFSFLFVCHACHFSCHRSVFR